MGRRSKGYLTTGESPRLRLTDLMKFGYFTKNAKVSGEWKWSNGDTAAIRTLYTETEAYMEIEYRYIDHQHREQSGKQRIEMEVRPSNLGLGSIVYFRCPFSGKLCRVLYRAYNCQTWRCRGAFGYRLYYASQVCSKLDRWSTRSYELEKRMETFRRMRAPGLYLGKATKRAVIQKRVTEEWVRMEELKWSLEAMPLRLRRSIEAAGFR